MRNDKAAVMIICRKRGNDGEMTERMEAQEKNMRLRNEEKTERRKKSWKERKMMEG